LAKKRSWDDHLQEILLDSVRVQEALLRDPLFDNVIQASQRIVACLRRGKKVILYGNGGSASDSLHIAGELVGRFGHHLKRRALPAISLSANPATLTAIANDFGYLHSFARQLEGLSAPGDVAIGISTSGNSPNVLEATKLARKRKLFTIGLTGETGGKLKRLSHLCLCVPSENTQRIQQSHITLGHAICELVEEALFG